MCHIPAPHSHSMCFHQFSREGRHTLFNVHVNICSIITCSILIFQLSVQPHVPCNSKYISMKSVGSLHVTLTYIRASLFPTDWKIPAMLINPWLSAKLLHLVPGPLLFFFMFNILLRTGCDSK